MQCHLNKDRVKEKRSTYRLVKKNRVTSDSQGNGEISRGNLTWISSGLRILVLLTAAPAYGSSNFLTLIKASHLVIHGDFLIWRRIDLQDSVGCAYCMLHPLKSLTWPDCYRLWRWDRVNLWIVLLITAQNVTLLTSFHQINIIDMGLPRSWGRAQSHIGIRATHTNVQAKACADEQARTRARNIGPFGAWMVK